MITAYLHKRNFTVLAVIVLIAATLFAFISQGLIPVKGNRGILFDSPNLWISNPVASLVVNLALTVALAVGAILINRTFNIMRAQTAIWASFFLFAQTALPSLAGQLYGGTLLCVSLVIVTPILFTCFEQSNCNRRIFLIFFIVTATAAFQYAAAFYIPLLFVGMAQMRVLGFKQVLAALLGIITLPWILFGCGIVHFDDINVPSLSGIFANIDLSDMIVTIIVVGATALLGLFGMCAMIMKVLSYNSKYRASNGFWSLLFLTTILLIAIDYNNIATYATLLEFTAAYQLSHFFSNHRLERSYIAILCIIAFYLIAYLSVTGF